jgi:hypothetical protein
MITIDKETLNAWINKDNLSYSEISRRLQCSITYVKKYARGLGIVLPIKGNYATVPWNKGLKKIYICKNCGKQIYTKGSSFRQFCSPECSGEYRRYEKLSYYLEHQEEFRNKEITYNWLKPLILEEQSAKCAICGMYPSWNGKELHFILDHIDGDATNNKRNNLRLICPNCDSQLDTYKSRNTGHSTRKYKPYREVIDKNT